MKNHLTLAGAIALAVNLIAALVNYLYYRSNGNLLIGMKTHGGEITIEHGFGGLRAVHIYGMTPDAVTTHTLRFSPLLFLISFCLTLVVVFALLKIVRRSA
jgi:hypothetical protein